MKKSPTNKIFLDENTKTDVSGSANNNESDVANSANSNESDVSGSANRNETGATVAVLKNNSKTPVDSTSKDMQNSNQLQSNQPTKLTKKQEMWNFVKFVLFSISAGAIQILSFTILNELIIKDTTAKYGWSYFISLFLSVLWNFTINRKFTFKSAKSIPIAMLLVFAFYCVFTPLSILWGDALTGAGWNEYLVLFLTMVINMVTEFLWTRFVVYKNSINTSKKKEKKDK